MAKVAIPSSKVEIELSPGSIEPAMKSADAKTTKLYKVPVAKIKTIPGFNVRVHSADYLAHRDMIAESIRNNGYDQTKPLSGYVAKEGDVNVIYITDGHTRLDAISVLNADESYTPKIEALPVLVHAGTTSLTDLTVALHTSNTGRPLTPFELGVVVKRLLRDEGADKTQIAARLSVTPRYLDDVLLLVNGPKEIRQAVLDGGVSSTMAIQTLRKSPDTAADIIATALAKAKAAGKTKATKKDTGPKMTKVRASVSIATDTDMKEIVKAVAALVRKAIPATEGEDEDGIKLSTVDGTISLVIEVPAPEKPVKAKKPKKAKKPAKVKAAAKKPAKTKVADDLGIEGAEATSNDDLDDEIVKLPPAVKNGEGVDDVEVDI